MQLRQLTLLSAVGWIAGTGLAFAQGQTLTIATVNNADMIIMQRLSPKWEQATGNKLNWVVLEENVLRERLTTDIATNSGQYDILTIGLFEAPMWGEREWLVPFDNTPADYEIDDVIKSMRDGLSHDGKLFALPFYGESQMTPLSQGSA
jgi:sorbitol/mannitol transport system substrate-binding protein